MFGDRDKFEREIGELLELYTLEDALEAMDITVEEVLSILLNNGHCELPPFLLIEEDVDNS